jgi:hypothetical protein
MSANTKPLLVPKLVMMLNNLPQDKIKLKLNVSRAQKKENVFCKNFFLSEQCSTNPPSPKLTDIIQTEIRYFHRKTVITRSYIMKVIR